MVSSAGRVVVALCPRGIELVERYAKPLAAARILLRIVPPVALVIWVAATAPWRELWPRIAEARWAFLGLALLVNYMCFLPIRALRWRMAMPDPPPFHAILMSLVEGAAAAAFVGTVMGDVVRTSRLRGSGSFATDFGATVADRACEYLALAFLLGGTALVGTIPMWWLAAPFGALAVVVSVHRWHALLEPRLARWPRIQAGVGALGNALTLRRATAMTALAFAGWASEIVMINLALTAVGLPSGAGLAALVVVCINVATALPGSPGNLGTFEVGVVFALAYVGIAQPAALSFALLYHALHLVPVAIIGAVSWTVRRPGGPDPGSTSTR